LSGSNVTYLRAEIGLTLQRNALIQNLPKNCEILHFIDDDSVVEPNYFAEIEATFQNNPAAVAVGGRILNLPKHTWTLAQRIFLVASKRQGVVLISGVNIMNFSGSEVREVDWLSGCSMSFRASIFSSINFDLNRAGNGIGEDVDFCLRAKSLGKVLWTPHACQQHLQSPVNRLKKRELRQSVLAHRLRLGKDRLGGVIKVFVFSAFFYEAVRSSIRPFVKRILGRND
jgi:GT2 family glycosyltransferase